MPNDSGRGVGAGLATFAFRSGDARALKGHEPSARAGTSGSCARRASAEQAGCGGVIA